VRAEDSSRDVRLVDDNKGQPQEEVGPPRMVRQNRSMEHVGVRHHEVRVSANQRALGPRGVAVVDRGLDLRELQLSDLAELIPGQRLRRK
jgi:hypothetical protein